MTLYRRWLLLLLLQLPLFRRLLLLWWGWLLLLFLFAAKIFGEFGFRRSRVLQSDERRVLGRAGTDGVFHPIGDVFGERILLAENRGRRGYIIDGVVSAARIVIDGGSAGVHVLIIAYRVGR